jgi:hypothetical protein
MEIEPHHLVERLWRDGEDAAVVVPRAAHVATRGVDQNVDATPPLEELVTRGRDLARVEHVGGKRDGFSPGGPDGLCLRLGRVTAPAENGNSDPRGGEAGRETSAKYAVTAGNDGNSAGERKRVSVRVQDCLGSGRRRSKALEAWPSVKL